MSDYDLWGFVGGAVEAECPDCGIVVTSGEVSGLLDAIDAHEC